MPPPPPPPPPALRPLNNKPGISQSGSSTQADAVHRSTELTSLFHSLNKLKTRQSETNRSPAAAGIAARKSTSSDQQPAVTHNALMAEFIGRSKYFMQIQTELEQYSDLLADLKTRISIFTAKDTPSLIEMYKHVDDALSKLTDESRALKTVPDWPYTRLAELRVAGSRSIKLMDLCKEMENWSERPKTQRVEDYVASIVKYFDRLKRMMEELERSHEDDERRFKLANIFFDFRLMTRLKHSTLLLSRCVLRSVIQEAHKGNISEKGAAADVESWKLAETKALLWNAVQFSSRVYSFAGGTDDDTVGLVKSVALILQNC